MLLQKILWAVMDFLKLNFPRFYKIIKRILKPFLKRLISWIYTLKQKGVIALNDNQKKVNKTAKISYILLETNDKKINNIINVIKKSSPFYKKNREIIIVSDSNKINIDEKIIIKKSLKDAILSSSGSYLCFLEKGDIPRLSSLKKIYKIINKHNHDMYLSNYIDFEGNFVDIYDPLFGYDFTKATLPIHCIFGVKIISREIAIKVRLPKTGVYSYLNEVSDKTNDIYFIQRPIIQNTLSKNSANKKLMSFIQSQEETIVRRYYFSSIKPVNSVKKVLFIAPWLVIGGAEKVLFDLSSEFIKRNISVDIFCTHGGGEWKNKFKKIGTNVYISKKQTIYEKNDELFKLVNSKKYDVIHTSNTEYGHYFAPKVKELSYRPIFIDTIHSHNNPLVNFSHQYQACIDGIISVNNYIKDSLSDKIIPEKITPIHNGVSVSHIKVEDSKFRYNNKKISFIGRISEEKNPLQFVEIIKRLSEKHPDWKYDVVGDGPLLEKMKSVADKYKISEKIYFSGYIQDGASKLSSSSCCVITSFTEGLPIVLLEALSMGVPVVSSDVGGINEVLVDGDNGYLVSDPNDTDEYVKSIEKLLSSYNKYEKYTLNAISSTKDHTAKQMADNVLDLYNKYINSINNKFDKVTTIAMLSYNRKDAIEKTLDTIYRNTDVPFNVLVLDNGSESETIKFLNRFKKSHNNFKVIFEKKNLGCPGGRHKMLKMIKSDYVVTIDNDMEVPKFWLRDLIMKIEDNKNIMGVCVKDVFPWGKIEFTGGSISKDENGFYLFNAVNYNKNYNDLSTLEEIDCDWMPGGATLWRGNIHDIAEHSLEYINAFEDFDYSLQVIKKGYKVVNCPSVIFIHNHSSGFSKKQQSKEAKYISDRNNENGFIISLAAFFRRTGYIMRNDKIYNLLNISTDATPKEVKKLVESYAATLKRP